LGKSLSLSKRKRERERERERKKARERESARKLDKRACKGKPSLDKRVSERESEYLRERVCV
jgi:hypothetical protein